MPEFLDKQTIKDLLVKHGLHPKLSLGQNFLIAQKPIAQMLAAAEIKSTDVILEIGPGLGSITEALVATGAKIMAVEKDDALVGVLRDRLGNTPNLEIIAGDILKILNPVTKPDCHSEPRANTSQKPCHSEPRLYSSDGEESRVSPPSAGDGPGFFTPHLSTNGGFRMTRINKIIANLPFYLTKHLIRQVLEQLPQAQLMVFIVQKEVAQKIYAQPPKMNLLAVCSQIYCQPKIISYVPKKCFWPQPKVDAAILKLTRPTEAPKINPNFFSVVKIGFSQPRKQLASNLARGLKLDKTQVAKNLADLNIPAKARAANLSVADWQKLTAVTMHHASSHHAPC